MRRRRDLINELSELQQQIDVMRAENARLRLEEQTPKSLAAIADGARALLETDHDGESSADQAASALADAYVMRSSILAVCEEMETTFAQLRVRLQSGAPPTELNRRVRDRRRAREEREEAERLLDDARSEAPAPPRDWNESVTTSPQLRLHLDQASFGLLSEAVSRGASPSTSSNGGGEPNGTGGSADHG